MKTATKLNLAAILPAVVMMVIIVGLAVRDMHRLIDHMADQAVTISESRQGLEFDATAYHDELLG